MVPQQLFDSLALHFRNQGILQLLRIDQRRILAEKRGHLVRRDHMLHHVVLLEHVHPRDQECLLHLAGLRAFIRIAATYQAFGVLRIVQPSLYLLFLGPSTGMLSACRNSVATSRMV